MHRIAVITLMASSLAACRPDQVRRTTPAELAGLASAGRRVNQAAVMQEAPGLALVSSGEARTYRFERGHDEGVPSLLQFDTQASVSIRPEEAAAYAADWLASNAENLGVAADELRPSARFATWLSDNVYLLSYDRWHAGLPVRDAYVQVGFAADADGRLRLREVLNRSHGAIRLENPEAQPASLDDAVEALRDVGLTPIAVRELIYPVKSDTLEIKMVRATEVRAFDEREGVEATVTLANGSYQPLEAYRHRYAARVGVRAMVQGRSYLDTGRVALPMPFTTVAGAGSTDADGTYEATLAAGAQVSLTLSSARVVAIPPRQNTPYVVTGSFDAEAQAVTLAPEADALIGVNAYMSILRINAFVRRHLRESEAPLLGSAIPVRTNVAGSCNAFYDGQGISLFAAGNGCANMALVNDVAYHEWGHGLDDSTGRTPGIIDGAFSEGIGDIVASYYTDSSNMAPGFNQGSTTGIRQLANTLRYPDNTFPNDPSRVHQEGLTIGGAFWDLRKSLIERYGATRGAFMAERFFFRHLLVTDSYLESYQTVMTLDDDDANPATPSPNKCLITAAFAKHGLAREEAGCQDKAAADGAARSEPAIALSVQTANATGVSLMAAGPKATRTLFACVGAEAECLKSKRQDVTFELDGVKGAKVLFVADKAVTLAEQQSVTVFALDGQGSLLGKRTFLLHAK